jgi:hypothetical protein
MYGALLLTLNMPLLRFTWATEKLASHSVDPIKNIRAAEFCRLGCDILHFSESLLTFLRKVMSRVEWYA